jgi:hypothetical protein
MMEREMAVIALATIFIAIAVMIEPPPGYHWGE